MLEEKKVRKNNSAMNKTKIRRLKRNRSKIKNKNLDQKPRIVVFASNKNFSAQLIYYKGDVLKSYSSINMPSFKGTGIAKAEEVGKKFAEICLESNHKSVVFDKGAKSYAGRVETFAKSCRESGLNF